MDRSCFVGLTLAFVLAGCVGGSGAAQADSPQIVERHSQRSGVLTSCDTFDVTFLAAIDSRYIISTDDNGQPTREIRHVAFTGTLTGPAGERPYSGHFTRTEDVQGQRARFTGLHFKVERPTGPPLIAAGLDAFSLDDTDDPRTAGRLPDAFYADVCNELAPR
jgi:hypothetical protein